MFGLEIRNHTCFTVNSCISRRSASNVHADLFTSSHSLQQHACMQTCNSHHWIFIILVPGSNGYHRQLKGNARESFLSHNTCKGPRTRQCQRCLKGYFRPHPLMRNAETGPFTASRELGRPRLSPTAGTTLASVTGAGFKRRWTNEIGGLWLVEHRRLPWFIRSYSETNGSSNVIISPILTALSAYGSRLDFHCILALEAPDIAQTKSRPSKIGAYIETANYSQQVLVHVAA